MNIVHPCTCAHSYTHTPCPCPPGPGRGPSHLSLLPVSSLPAAPRVLRVQDMGESRPSLALSPCLTHPQGRQGSGRRHLLQCRRALRETPIAHRAGVPQPLPASLPCKVTWGRAGQIICKEPESRCFRFMGHEVYVTAPQLCGFNAKAAVDNSKRMGVAVCR